MLQPKRVKYRRPQDGRGNKGNAHRGTHLAFGSFGINRKPADVRMGKGKGDPAGWVAPVTPGRILFEVEGVT